MTPDRLYLWKGAGVEPKVVQPSYEIDAQPIFLPYVERTQVRLEDVHLPAFELIVTTWFRDLIRSEETVARPFGEGNGLSESGFVEALRGGRVEYELAA